eukprot:Transcript_30905.p1 GENE.Transcript_30905~~Transcript_30905.p1  ORF type:complete len:420 (-),score=141.46 Transcript_30905:212-1471(-)
MTAKSTALLLLSCCASCALQSRLFTPTRSAAALSLRLVEMSDKAEDPQSEDPELRRELQQRIAEVAKSDKAEMALLSSLMDRLTSGEAQERQLYTAGNASLPVVCLDAMLPRQQMRVDTDDEVFCRLLRDVGLGGHFVMTSLFFRQKRVRRSGVVVRVEQMDARYRGAACPDDCVPTTVRALLVGRRRVRINGPSEGLKLRVGRYRSSYTTYQGQGKGLGWGLESFVDRADADGAAPPPAETAAASLPYTDWSLTSCEVLGEADEAPLYEAGSACDEAWPEALLQGVDFGRYEGLLAEAQQLQSDLQHWLELARNPRTYDNIDVTAGTRARRGEPGLRVDPERLLSRVLDDLGPQPSPTAPTALALWGAALINPLPPLGVATEVRGAALEAASTEDRLTLVRRAVRKSIANLEGRQPLI